MNRKYLVFGLMGLFALALVSAGLVNYLSNTTEKDIAVESPLNLTVEDFVVVTPYNFEMQIINFTLKNNAVVPVNTIVETTITGDSDESEFSSTNVGEEFATLRIGIVIETVDSPEACTYATGDHFEDGYCYWDASYDRSFTGVDNGVYYVQMGDGNVPIEASQTLEGRMQLQFNTAVQPATYTFTTEAVTVNGARDLTNV